MKGFEHMARPNVIRPAGPSTLVVGEAAGGPQFRPAPKVLVDGELPCLCDPNPFQCGKGCKCVGCGCLKPGFKKRLRHHRKVEAKLRVKAAAETLDQLSPADIVEVVLAARKPKGPKVVFATEQLVDRLAAEAREANGLQAGITLPLRLGRGQNDRGLDRWRRVRVKKRRAAARGALALMKPLLEVTVTRIAPSSGLDPADNLPASMKEVIDEFASWLGIDDGDERVKFIPAQERGPWNVRIEVRLVGRAR